MSQIVELPASVKRCVLQATRRQKISMQIVPNIEHSEAWECPELIS